jgi:plastocyanin domain-containing protein
MKRRIAMKKSSGLWLLSGLLALAGCAGTAQAPVPPGAVAISVTEKGFVPAEVTVRKGEPVTLVVTRKTNRTCATEFVMKSHGIREALPLNQAVEIRFTPTETGEIRYACGMDMIAGKVIVQ